MDIKKKLSLTTLATTLTLAGLSFTASAISVDSAAQPSFSLKGCGSKGCGSEGEEKSCGSEGEEQTCGSEGEEQTCGSEGEESSCGSKDCGAKE